MTYDLTRGITTIRLPDPTVGNKLTNDYGLIARQSRGGDSRYVRDKNWPELVTETLTFTGVKQDVLDSLRTFLQTNAGKKINVANTIGTSHELFVKNPDFEFICDRESACTNYYTFNLIVEYYTPIPNTPETSTYYIAEDGTELNAEDDTLLRPEFA